MWQSSNPALNNKSAFSDVYDKDMFAAKANVTTLSGVVNKTMILVAITVAAGAFGYSLLESMPSILWISGIASFGICLGFYFLLAGKPALSPIIAPIYAIVEGCCSPRERNSFARRAPSKPSSSRSPAR